MEVKDKLKVIVEMQDIEKAIRFERYVKKRANTEIEVCNANMKKLEEDYQKLKSKLN